MRLITERALYDMETGRLLEMTAVIYDGPVEECRGSSGPAPSASYGAGQEQLGTTNAIGGQAAQAAGDLRKKLVPGYTSLMDTGYLSPEQENAAVTSEMGAATAPFQAANFRAANRAAATRNPADLTAQEDQLALEQGQTAGTAAANLQKEKTANQVAGMQGLSNEELQQLALEKQMYGLGPPTLGTMNGQTSSQGGSFGFGPLSIS